MTLEKLAVKYLQEIGDSLTFDKAKSIANEINALTYSKSGEKISQTDKDIIFDMINQGIVKNNISIQYNAFESANSKQISAANMLLKMIKGNGG